jgi:Tfp pilus assembly protein PilW
MRIRARTVLERLAHQRGVTLIELVFAMSLAIVVIGAPLTFMVVSLHQHNTVISRTDAVRDAEVGLDRLMRDLRQADPTQSVSLTWASGSASAVFYILTPGTAGASDQKITWTCSANASCTRQVGTGSVTTQIKYVTSTSFAPKDANGNTLTSGSSTTPAYVGITLTMKGVSQDGTAKAVAARGITQPITLSAGVDLWGNTT